MFTEIRPFGRATRALFASLAITLLFTGCVTSNRTALAPAIATELTTVHVTATVNQPEIAADINQSNIAALTGGGLIAALIDTAVEAKRAKKAENIITPLRDSLVNFDCAESLRSSLEAKMMPGSTVPVKLVNLTNPMDEKTVIQYVKNHEADAVLLITADYRLSPDFDRIRVLAKARLISKKSAAAGEKPLYENYFATFRAMPIPVSKEKTEAIKQWSENNGHHAREALQACFLDLAEMIEFDLQQGPEANSATKDKRDTYAPPAGPLATIQPAETRGTLVRKNAVSTWVRMPMGELSSTY